MVQTILNSRKSFLYFEGNPWVKKDTTEHFDVTEGSFDGAEVCEIVGLFLLKQLNELIANGSVGLYRDDGLAAVHGYSGPEMDRLRKQIIDLFKLHGFQITIDINLKCTDFLDLQLDLENNKYHPYKKPNDTPLYVNRGSNHPGNILKQLPKMTAQRLSSLSCNKEEFDKCSLEYQEVLKKSGFNEKLDYTPPVRRNRRQRRNIIWYNPPFDLQVKTNIGKTFLRIIDKHFPTHHRLHPIINRNNVKISYCCMPNMASHIKAHNRKVLQENNPPAEAPERTCNCRDADNCPLDGNCLQNAVVYQSDVTPDPGEPQYYVGVTEPMFKYRWNDHNSSFRNEQYKNKSKLSALVWKLKEEGKNYNLKWSILKKSSPYRAGSKRCNLCLWEKYFIINGDNKMINKKDELLGKCRHREKFLLKNYKNRNRGIS